MTIIQPITTQDVERQNGQAELSRRQPNAHLLEKQTKRGLCLVCNIFSSDRSYVRLANPSRVASQPYLLICDSCINKANKVLGRPGLSAYQDLETKVEELEETVAAQAEELDTLNHAREFLASIEKLKHPEADQ